MSLLDALHDYNVENQIKLIWPRKESLVFHLTPYLNWFLTGISEKTGIQAKGEWFKALRCCI